MRVIIDVCLTTCVQLGQERWLLHLAWSWSQMYQLRGLPAPADHLETGTYTHNSILHGKGRGPEAPTLSRPRPCSCRRSAAGGTAHGCLPAAPATVPTAVLGRCVVAGSRSVAGTSALGCWLPRSGGGVVSTTL